MVNVIDKWRDEQGDPAPIKDEKYESKSLEALSKAQTPKRMRKEKMMLPDYKPSTTEQVTKSQRSNSTTRTDKTMTG